MRDTSDAFEQLECIIGREAALKVCKVFEGESVYFPKSILLGEEHARIFAELRGGATYKTVAAKYGYTTTNIRKIEHRMRAQQRAGMKGPSLARRVVSPPRVVASAPDTARDNGQGELFV